jgi:hypothetical protein
MNVYKTCGMDSIRECRGVGAISTGRNMKHSAGALHTEVVGYKLSFSRSAKTEIPD